MEQVNKRSWMQQSAQQSSSSTAGKGLVNRDTTVQYSSDIRIPIEIIHTK